MRHSVARIVTPKVRSGGRPLKKNRWDKTRDPDSVLLAGIGLTIETRAPGPGARHVLSERDVRRFLRCIPEGDKYLQGLRAIVLAPRKRGSLAMCNGQGIIYLYAWDEDFFRSWDEQDFNGHRPLLERFGVLSEPKCQVDDEFDCKAGEWLPSAEVVPVAISTSMARAFMLTHVFLHELGHHIDRRPKAATREREEFAEKWALSMFEAVWPKYIEFFGRPKLGD